MFTVSGLETLAEIRGSSECDGIIRYLQIRGHCPLLRMTADAAAEIAKLPAGSVPVGSLLIRDPISRINERSNSPVGDIFLEDHAAFMVFPAGPRLCIWEIRQRGAPPRLEAFGDEVIEAVRSVVDGRRLRGMKLQWKAAEGIAKRRVVFEGPRLSEAKLSVKPPDYSEVESGAALLLAESEARNLALRIAQVGKVRTADASTESKKEIAESLLSAGILKEEYLILCRQDSHTICTSGAGEDSGVQSGGSLSCAVCGRRLTDEVVHEILALTDLGRSLLNGSKWMMVWITDLLIASGVEIERIGWNPESGQDELDIMLEELGARIFFELKDREFGLGDAYPFAFRVSRYGGAQGVIVTTDKVADEAKKFFREQGSQMRTLVTFLEGADGIGNGLRRVLDRVARQRIGQILAEFMPHLSINLWPLMQQWMDKAERSYINEGKD